MDQWDEVTIIRKKPASTSSKAPSNINAAMRSGAQIETTKKFGAGQNRQPGTGKDTAKLDRETEDFHHERVGKEVGLLIQKARVEKGWTQKDLAQRINEKPQVVNEFESGVALNNQGMLSKLERVLGVRLRGKNKGEPFTFGKKAEPSAASGSY